MSEPTLHDVLNAIQKIDQKIDTVEKNLTGRIDQLDKRVEQLDEHVGLLDKRVEQLDEHVGLLDKRVEQLDERVGLLELAVYEVRKDHREIEYMQDKLIHHDKMIWGIRKELKMTSGE